MNNKMLMAALGACAITAAAVPANAQSTTPTGLSLKLGVFWPTDSATRDATSDTWFDVGLEYRLKDMPVTNEDMKSHLSVSLDWATHSDVRIMPVMFNYVMDQRQTYWMIGAGAAFVHGSGSDDTRFAYQFGLGYNFQQGPTPAFVEARYIGTSESSEAGMVFAVGVRF